MNNDSKEKVPSDSETTMTELVFPNDTNPLGILRGGRLMDWMDTASAICAQTHADTIAVTASVDRLVFNHPVRLGDVLTLKAKVTRVFRTSLEIFVEVTARRIPGGTSFISNTAYYTFVALDTNACPVLIPAVVPETPQEIIEFENALARYNSRKSISKRSSSSTVL
jgi:acyl-CoA hydrolase